MKRYLGIILGLSAGLSFYLPASGQLNLGQDSLVRENAVKVFIDCNNCDMNYIRQEIPYVNYVRDVREAQVYLREAREMTGSGGQKYTFTFLGQQNYAGMNDTLVYASRPDDTFDQTRNRRTQMMKMGLMRYVAKTPVYSQVNIQPSRELVAEEVIDRWNNWVFELETRPSVELEETLKEIQLRNSISISKISHDWKVEIDMNHNYTSTRYTYDDTTYTRNRNSERMNNLVVRSLGEHWAAGARMEINSSTFSNTKLGLEFFPSLEYNLFPYSESTHRQLRFLYGFGGSFNRYNDSTIYDLVREDRLQHKLQIAYQVQEKWGSVNISLEGSNYFYDLSKNRVELNGFINIRIVKGLSLSLRGSVARVNDQLSLVKGELSEADILLRLQELATAYEFNGSFGISYTFGSIYNNIVNPRFGNGGYGGGGGGYRF